MFKFSTQKTEIVIFLGLVQNEVPTRGFGEKMQKNTYFWAKKANFGPFLHKEEIFEFPVKKRKPHLMKEGGNGRT